MSLAWHIAAFSRAQRLPSFDSIIEREHKPQAVEQMIAACRHLAASCGAKEQIVE